MDRKYVSSVRWIILLYSFIPAVYCDCGKPPNIPYGRLQSEFESQTTFDVAITVKYYCEHGFVRVPGTRNEVTCLENSTWSSNDEFCIPRSCGHPGEIDNGYFEAENYFFGSRVTYHCDLGFYMVSSRWYRDCKADGTWTNNLPICEATMCPPPPVIANATFYPMKEEYSFLDSVRYKCGNPDTVMEYDSSIFCMDNGRWSDPKPRCIEVNCPPPNVPHSRKLLGFVGPYTLQSFIKFKCDEGLTMKGSDTVFCNMDSQWEPSPPACIVVRCTPPVVQNSRKLFGFVGPYTLHSIIKFQCKEGYTMEGSDTVICNMDSTWEPSVPTCIATRPPTETFYPVTEEYDISGGVCPEPRLLHGRVIQGKKTDGYEVNDSVTLDCDIDYELNGESNVTCGKDFQWFPEIPSCKLKVKCEPPNVPHSKKIFGFVGSYRFNSIVKFQCDEGLIMNGSDMIFCNMDGRWEPSPPNCIEANCEPPNVPHSQKLFGFVGPYTKNSLIKYRCDEGFIMEGSDTIVCNMDSKWEPSPPHCKAPFCTEPKIMNGTIIQEKKSDRYKMFDIITLGCDSGYKLKGPRKLRCEKNFQWSLNLPICELENGCSSPTIPNGRISHKNCMPYDPQTDGHGFSNSDEINIMCNSGYRLYGKRKSKCTARFWTISWLPSLPSCRKLVV